MSAEDLRVAVRASVASALTDRRNRQAHADAYDAMARARPLKPPPMPAPPARLPASRRVLARDRELGIIDSRERLDQWGGVSIRLKGQNQ